MQMWQIFFEDHTKQGIDEDSMQGDGEGCKRGSVILQTSQVTWHTQAVPQRRSHRAVASHRQFLNIAYTGEESLSAGHIT